jgi:hypothetical protein
MCKQNIISNKFDLNLSTTLSSYSDDFRSREIVAAIFANLLNLSLVERACLSKVSMYKKRVLVQNKSSLLLKIILKNI